MTYSTTITQKGQITIPKEIRDALKINKGERLLIEFKEGEEEIRIKPTLDILDIAGTFKVKKNKNILRARDKFENKYERL